MFGASLETLRRLTGGDAAAPALRPAAVVAAGRRAGAAGAVDTSDSFPPGWQPPVLAASMYSLQMRGTNKVPAALGYIHGPEYVHGTSRSAAGSTAGASTELGRADLLFGPAGRHASMVELLALAWAHNSASCSRSGAACLKCSLPRGHRE